MRRASLALGLLIWTAASPAAADPLPSLAGESAAPAPAGNPAPPATPAAAPPVAAPPAAPVATGTGMAVVALAGAADAAWPLAQSIYGNASLRPASLDEPRARVLCGEAPAATATQELRDLADAVAAVHGEDAASRAILGDLARRLNVKGLVVVHTEGGRPQARVFLAETGAFDAALYGPDEGTLTSWFAATRSLKRSFGAVAAAPAPAPYGPEAPPSAPPLATHEEPPPPDGSGHHPFYASGWFWGALGAAAFAGGAVFFATRDNSAQTIHLQMQVPH